MEEAVCRTVTEKNSRCTMVREGPEGEEALKTVTLNNGDVKRYWGDKGAERYDRIDKADGSVETYSGTTGGEYCTRIVTPHGKITCFGGAKATAFKSHEFVDGELRWYQRTGAPEDRTSEWVMKVDKYGLVYWRGSERDEFEEVVIPKAAIKARAEQKRAAAEASARAKREREAQEKEDRERAKRAREAEARLGGRTLCVGSMQGADKGNINELDMENIKAFDQANC